MQKVFSTLLQTCLYTFSFLFTTSQISIAQVTSDNTVNTQVELNANVAEITGGETRGDNLFHSFQDFSVSTGNEAYFNNAVNIENIFSRVTGGNISDINGLIRANGSADLFLINPAGIIFGENARLDIGGSFLGSTATSILFDNGEFSAADLENPPLLTINAPIGLGFRDNPGEIVNRANSGLIRETFNQTEPARVDRITAITGLEVNPGQDLALIGGNVSLEDNSALIGGKVSLEGGGITAPGGNVTLGGLSQAGEIAIADGNFSFADDANKADLSLSNNAKVSVVGNGGGSINIDVNKLELTGRSQLLAGIAEGAGDSNTVAGDIVINASESVMMTGSGISEDPTLDLDTAILNTVGLPPERVGNANDVTNTAGSSGSIFINTKKLELTERAAIETRLYGVGNAGDVNINADTVLLNKGTITSQVGFQGSKGTGNSGDININTNNFEATNSTFVITDNGGTGKGDAGDINLSAIDSVVIEEDNALTAFISETGEGTIGNAGDINIVAGNINIVDNSLKQGSQTELLTQVRGKGNTGAINLEVADSLVISGNGAALKAQILETGEGKGGNIEINTNTFELSTDTSEPDESNFSQLLTDSRSLGDSGDIIIQARESVFADNGIIISQIGDEGVGDTGDIKITANSLKLENDAQLLTEIEGIGNAGSIDLEIADSLVIEGGSDVQAQVLDTGKGDGGNIEINTDTFELIGGELPKDNSQLLSDSRGEGNSGEISIQTDESFNVSNSTISTGNIEDSQGNSGKIDIISPQVFLTDRSIISSSTESNGNTADITIDAQTISLNNFSLITASSRNEMSGEAGNINLTSDRVTLKNGSIINATSSSRFDGGEININSRLLELFSGGVLQTASDSNGNAGNINLIIGDRIILDGNDAPDRPENFDFAVDDDLLNNLEGKTGIFANAENDTLSNGGNIKIDTNFIVAFPGGNSDIIAGAQGGQGGTITINVESLLGIDEGSLSPSSNDINASSSVDGLDGSVTINSLDVDPVQGATELPTRVVEAEQTIAQVCQGNREEAAKNSFTVKGKGGIPAEPGLPLDSRNISLDGDLTPGDGVANSIDSISAIPQPVETSQGKIQPARGIKFTKSGEVILTAYRTNNAGERILETKRNCN